MAGTPSGTRYGLPPRFVHLCKGLCCAAGRGTQLPAQNLALCALDRRRLVQLCVSPSGQPGRAWAERCNAGEAAPEPQWPLTWGPSGVGVGVFSGLRAGLGQGPCFTCTGFTCRGASGGGQLRPGLPPTHTQHPPSPGACLFTKHLASTHCVLGPAPSTFSRQLPGARFADEETGAQR